MIGVRLDRGREIILSQIVQMDKFGQGWAGCIASPLGKKKARIGIERHKQKQEILTGVAV